jgi:hypothetical protein
LLLALLACLASTPASAAARAWRGLPEGAAIRAAGRAAARDDRILVARAISLQACVRRHPRRPGRCAGDRGAVQAAGSRLAHARHRLARVAGASARASRTANLRTRRAPHLRVRGASLAWTRVRHAHSYLLRREAPGRASEFVLVAGTRDTPAPLPGLTVSYRVRATIAGSAWSGAQTIAYAVPQSSDSQAAPTLSADGATLSWNSIAGVGAYVLVSRRPGAADSYSAVGGTSATPAPVPGATVRYSVRTAVPGSAWSSEVAVAYPAGAAAPKPEGEGSGPAPGAAGGGLQPGINAGWIYPGQLDASAVQTLGAKLVRVEFPIEWSAAQLQPTIAGYAAKGIRVAPLATFDGRLPSPAEARSLASWAAAYGSGGTFWTGRSDGDLAIRTIEFGNETSGGYQYGDNAGDASYTERARTYAVRLKEAAQSIAAAGAGVGMLAVAEDWTGDWMSGMFAAVPNLGEYVAGWVSHPYGTDWRQKIEDIVAQAAAHGASAAIPVDVTEWGVASDNGRCLSDNYGWNPCMSYAQAAETLRATLAGIRSLLGPRLAMFLLYQSRDQQASGASSEREAYFGLLQHEDQPKGAYTSAAEELLAG